MRQVLTLISLSLLIGAAQAAPNPDRPDKRKPLPSTEVELFTQSLQDLIHEVARHFIRADAPDAPGPALSEQELTAAALGGLYQAAGLPTPSRLGRDARACPDAVALHELIRKTRTELGNREALRGSAAVMAGVRGILPHLDKAATIVGAQEVMRGGFNEFDQNPGLELTLGSRPLVVKNVLPGGPGQRAGLLPGDRIVSIDGAPPMTALSSRLPMASPPLTAPVSQANLVMLLRVERPESHERFNVRLACGRFRPESILGVSRAADNSWTYWIDHAHRIAHVRVGPLVQGTAEELSDALNKLRDTGLHGLILDLRWCPGGVPDQVAAITRLFLSDGVIMVLRDHEEVRTARAGEPAPFADLPLIVLVNAETMGGAELIAAALQDNHRALIAGQRTFGKATMQRLLPVPEAGYLKVTSGMLTRPSGKNLQRHTSSKDCDEWGVRPDPGLEFRMSPALTARLKDQWLRQTLRPGGSTLALPLDDSANDPQRQAALHALLEKIQDSDRTTRRTSH